MREKNNFSDFSVRSQHNKMCKKSESGSEDFLNALYLIVLKSREYLIMLQHFTQPLKYFLVMVMRCALKLTVLPLRLGEVFQGQWL